MTGPTQFLHDSAFWAWYLRWSWIENEETLQAETSCQGSSPGLPTSASPREWMYSHHSFPEGERI
jgi:hypothetical protein